MRSERRSIPLRAEDVEIGLGILRSIREDAANGQLLTNIAGLISAEVFNDFLEMAEHLLDAGYVPPAASLIGAVLEDGLRRIADAHDVAHVKGDGLAILNDSAPKLVFTAQ